MHAQGEVSAKPTEGPRERAETDAVMAPAYSPIRDGGDELKIQRLFCSLSRGAGREGTSGGVAYPRALIASRISSSSFSLVVGGGGSAGAASCLRWTAPAALTIRKTEAAMIRNWTTVFKKAP